MGVVSGLGTVVAAVSEITAIVRQAKEIVSNTNTVLEEVEGIIQKLNGQSEGPMANVLNDAVQFMKKVFKKLIDALNAIFNFITSAMTKNQTTDEQGANALKAVLH